MNQTTMVTAGRCLLTWLVVTAATVTLLTWVAPDLAAPPPVTPFPSWLSWWAALVTVLCVAWGWLVTSVVVVEVLVRRPPHSPTGAVPTWARRLVLAACGVAVVGWSAPAVAANEPGDTGLPAHHAVLAGLPLPDRAEGRGQTELAPQPAQQPARQPAAGPRSDHRTPHLVRPGDSLWSIAETTLREAGTPTSVGAVAKYWPRLYALNRDVVGADPDLIQPGLQLQLAHPAPSHQGKEPR